MRPSLTALFVFLLTTHPEGYAQEVKGRVLSLGGKGIGGVNVLVKGTPQGAATDMNGAFKLSVPEGHVVLIFSWLKHKTVEQAVDIRKGYQYHVTIFLAGKAQTFNSSHAIIGELPLDCAVAYGVVTDQDGRPLAGVDVKQEKIYFPTVTDGNGKFTLPVHGGENTLIMSLAGYKSLELPIHADTGSRLSVHITLTESKSKFGKRKSSGEVSAQP